MNLNFYNGKILATQTYKGYKKVIKSELIFEVFHVGSMDISKRNPYLSIFTGLNVYSNVQDIKKQDNDELVFKLNKAPALFAKFDDKVGNEALLWGLENEYLEERIKYVYKEEYSEEEPTFHLEYRTMEEAKKELNSVFWNQIETKKYYMATDKMKTAFKDVHLSTFHDSNMSIFLLYIQEQSVFDGVWFDETGIIFDNKLNSWNVETV